MRRFAALAGIAAATALAGPVPSAAGAGGGLSMSLRLSGSVIAVWHGDRARGCAAAGVCDAGGSASYRPGFDGWIDVSRDGVGFGGSDAAQPAVVRTRDGGAGAPVTCADVLEPGFTPLGVDYLGDELQVTLQDLELSAGRCGGPRTLDLSHALPHGSVATSSLRKAARVLDLSARTKFAAGPFSGEVISTVRVSLGRARRGSESPFLGSLRLPSGGGGRKRYWVLDLRYRIKAVSGALVTDFTGLPDPACRALGACGARGSSAYTLSGVSGRLDVIAGGRLRRGRKRPRLAAALRALRRGSLSPYVDSRFAHGRAAVSESVTAPGLSCSDSLFTEQPYIDARSSRTAIVLLLRSSNPGSPGDALRTRCPGPSQSDVLRRASLAHGTIARRALGTRALTVSVGSTRAFARNGYAGSRHGRLELQLELDRSRVYVVRG